LGASWAVWRDKKVNEDERKTTSATGLSLIWNLSFDEFRQQR